MKLLSLIDSFGHGGAETVLVDVVVGLPEHDHRVITFSSANGIAPEPAFLRDLSAAGVPVDDVHWTTIRDAAARATLLGGFEPDVVLVHWWGRDPWWRWLVDPVRKASGPPFVLVLHHPTNPVLPGFDRYVLVSPVQAPLVARFPPDRVVTIPNGVDASRFVLSPRRDRPGIVIGRLSNLRPGKIPPDWVVTAASFDVPDASWVIAGDGELRAGLVEDARRLGVTDRFSFPGHVPRDEVPALLAGFDVFCYATSDVDAHPLAVLEAMASGLPIVAARVGAMEPPFLEHGVDALLAGSPQEMSDHLRRLADDPALRRRLGDAARATAVERYSLTAQLGAYRRLLDEVLAAPRTGAGSPATVAS